MTERNTEKYKCLYFCYQRYCMRTYFQDIKKYGWADLTEYKCLGKCKYFKKKTLWNRFVFWLCR